MTQSMIYAMDLDGDSWWVRWNNTEHSGARDIVIPKAFRMDAVSDIAGGQFVERHQIILLGFAYNVLTGTGPLGFRIVSVDGDGTTRVIYQVAHATAAVVADTVNCFIKLSPGGAASPASNGATLRIEPVGSLVTGEVTLWGLHTSADGNRVFPGIDTPPYTYQ